MKADVSLTSRLLPGFPNMVDLLVGLLRSANGSIAGHWGTFRPRVQSLAGKRSFIPAVSIEA
jgi:hypothetical protein